MAIEKERLPNGNIVYILADGSEVEVDPRAIEAEGAALQSSATKGQELKPDEAQQIGQEAAAQGDPMGAGLMDMAGAISEPGAKLPAAVKGAAIGGAAGAAGGPVGMGIGATLGMIAPPQETPGAAGGLIGGAATDAALRALPGGNALTAGKALLRMMGQGVGTFGGMQVENAVRRSLGNEVPLAGKESMFWVPVLSVAGAGVAEGIAQAVSRVANSGSATAVARAVNRLEGANAETFEAAGFAERLGSRGLSTMLGTEETAARASSAAHRMFSDKFPIKLSPAEYSKLGSQMQRSVAQMQKAAAVAKKAGTPLPQAEDIGILSKAMKFNAEDPAAMTRAIFGQSEDDQVRTIQALRNLFAKEGNDEMVDQLANEWLWRTVINPATDATAAAAPGGPGFGFAQAGADNVSSLNGRGLLDRVNKLGGKIDEVFGEGRAQTIRDVATVMDLATAGGDNFVGKDSLSRLRYLGNRLMFVATVGAGPGAAIGAAVGGAPVMAGSAVAFIGLSTILQKALRDPHWSKQFLAASKEPSGAALTSVLRQLSTAQSSAEAPPVAPTGR